MPIIPNNCQHFQCRIGVISTLGECGRINILPQHSVPLGKLLLGHFPEGQAEHYVCHEQVEQFNDESDHHEPY